jgi:hypothetical protein
MPSFDVRVIIASNAQSQHQSDLSLAESELPCCPSQPRPLFKLLLLTLFRMWPDHATAPLSSLLFSIDTRTKAFRCPFNSFLRKRCRCNRTASTATVPTCRSAIPPAAAYTQDPDTDAIFRLTRPGDVGRVWFSAPSPAVGIPSGVFVPVNAQAVMFHHNALWALVVPTSPHDRVADIWRSYWLQPLLWLLHGHVAGCVFSVNCTTSSRSTNRAVRLCVCASLRFAVVTSGVVHLRNAHDYHADFIGESALYTHAGVFVRRGQEFYRRVVDNESASDAAHAVCTSFQQEWATLSEYDPQRIVMSVPVSRAHNS